MRAPRISRRVIALFVLLVAACGERQENLEQPAPVVVVGLDGASWNAVEVLWEQRRLPNLRDLAQAGVGPELMEEPRAPGDLD